MTWKSAGQKDLDLKFLSYPSGMVRVSGQHLLSLWVEWRLRRWLVGQKAWVVALAMPPR